MFPTISYKLFREKNLNVRYHLVILKCGISLKGLFKVIYFLRIGRSVWNDKYAINDYNYSPIVKFGGLGYKPWNSRTLTRLGTWW